jgi:uncharacterized protein (TIRG00374 family)
MRSLWSFIVRHLRTIAYLIVIGLAVYYVFTHQAEITNILNALGNADGRWLLLAVAEQILWLVIIAGALIACYRLMGINENLSRMVPVMAAANFINVVAPSYGAGAMAVFIADGRQRGKPAGKVSTASLLYSAYDYLGMLISIGLGFVILAVHELLKPGYIIAAVFVFTIGISLTIIMTVGVFAADRLEPLLTGLAKWVNRRLRPFTGKNLLSLRRIAKFARDIAAGLTEIRRSPTNLILPGVLTLARKLAMVLILYLVSLAYRTPLELPNLIATFSISYLFTIASFTPSGVGFVETAMPVTMNSFGIGLDKAVAIALAYRGITFWLTLAYGIFAVRWVGYKPTVNQDTQPVAATAPNPLTQSMDASANPGSHAEVIQEPLSPTPPE